MFLLGLGITLAGLIGAVAAGVAIGLTIFKIASLLFSWLANKIKQKLKKRNVSKVAVGELGEIIKNCHNQATVDELIAIQSQGVTHFSTEVQNDGTIDESSGIEVWDVEKEDQQTCDFIKKTGEGMVVVSA